MSLNKLNKYKIVLASNSPRRKELLAGLGLDFTVRVSVDVDESYAETHLHATEIAAYLATKKYEANRHTMANDELLITADTVVIVDDEVLGKPMSELDARRMLTLISGRTHQVITGVCLATKNKCKTFSVTTDVTFKDLSSEEIDYYIQNYHPMDKAGAYGIQEWIGYVGVTELRGSYYNVMGLPIQRIYQEMSNM